MVKVQREKFLRETEKKFLCLTLFLSFFLPILFMYVTMKRTIY